MPARLYSCNAVLKQLTQDIEDMAAELGQFIQEEQAMVCQQHPARHWHLPAADQPHIGDRVMGPRNGCAVTKTVRSRVRRMTL
jgi:hypothetical protein